ncbi:hypothetical protein J2X50_003954 [Aminobacter sp. BE322]
MHVSPSCMREMDVGGNYREHDIFVVLIQKVIRFNGYPIYQRIVFQ